jgi:hypothetical protein
MAYKYLFSYQRKVYAKLRQTVFLNCGKYFLVLKGTKL